MSGDRGLKAAEGGRAGARVVRFGRELGGSRIRLVPFLVAVFIALLTTAPAGPVSEEEAREAAIGWTQAVEGALGVDMPAIGEGTPGIALLGEGRIVAHVFEGFYDGFVMVAADDLLSPILAYSEDTRFDPDVPAAAILLEAAAFRLRELEGEEAAFHPGWEAVSKAGLPAEGEDGRIGPLLSSRWKQGDPYNRLCPYDVLNGGRSVVGCVATSMAQVMHFHQHPPRGTGEHSYVWREGTAYEQELSANFDTEYDWENMPNWISASSPQAEIDAVAKLCYHCGVSVDMDYSSQGSGAAMGLARRALYTYFFYWDTSSYERRHNYTDAEWFDLMEGEIGAARPVLYGMYNASDEGHAIVLDGTDDSGGLMFVHLNMGWGGYSDGWYAIGDFPDTWEYGHQGIIGVEPISAITPTPTPSPSISPTPTATPTATPTPTPTASPSPTPTPTPTVSPSPTPTATPTPSPTPSVTVTSPNGGEVWYRGGTYEIRWESEEGGTVDIDLYKGGSLYRAVVWGTTNDGSYEWTVPTDVAVGSDYRVKVTSASVFDYSDGYFAIGEATHVTVSSPNGGEVWSVGRTYEITWDSDEGRTVDIDLYKGGSFRRAIASEAPNDGLYEWTVPGDVIIGSDYKVMITSDSDSDQSDGFFTIEGPAYLTVLSPNGGETLYTGGTHEVTWTSNEGGTVDIDLYAGESFCEGIVSGTPNDGSYEWSIGSGLSIGLDYRVKVAGASAFDYSDGYFAIEEGPYVEVLSPNGGELWRMGETYEVSWESNEGGTVDIDVYDGASLHRAIASGTPNDGSYEWTIPGDVGTGSEYRVKVTGGSDFDYSDGYFTIDEAAYVRVVSPSAGELWRIDGTYEIGWESNEGGTVDIDLYKGSGLERGIASETSNDGSYEWTVPGDVAIGSDYLVKVTSASDFDYSDGYFGIGEKGCVTVISPNGGEVWRVTRMYEIRWESNEGGTVDIQLYKGDSLYRNIGSATPNDGSYEWIVPVSVVAGSDYRVRIASGSDKDYSDGFFSVEEEPRVIPENPAVWRGEWLHFTTTFGAGGEWSLILAPSGGKIDAGTGIYQVGETQGVTDIVMVSAEGESLATSITVTLGPRAVGTAGPPTSMDVDGGGVGLSDVILMLSYVVGVETPTAEQASAADFDCDGSVGLGDVLNALRIVVGLEPVL